jgi:hypothetical protein
VLGIAQPARGETIDGIAMQPHQLAKGRPITRSGPLDQCMLVHLRL